MIILRVLYLWRWAVVSIGAGLVFLSWWIGFYGRSHVASTFSLIRKTALLPGSKDENFR